jgi:hypothetical protein
VNIVKKMIKLFGISVLFPVAVSILLVGCLSSGRSFTQSEPPPLTAPPNIETSETETQGEVSAPMAPPDIETSESNPIFNECASAPGYQPEFWQEHLQDFIPGSVRLFENPQDVFGGSSERIPQRRQVFYLIDGFILDLVSHEEVEDFRLTILSRDSDVMPLVQFIQHFNISREVMESALMQMYEARMGIIDFTTQIMLEAQAMEKMMENSTEVDTGSNMENRDYTSWPWYDHWADPMHEVNELPNLDIIFTFDNEIINWFYRRA